MLIVEAVDLDPYYSLILMQYAEVSTIYPTIDTVA